MSDKKIGMSRAQTSARHALSRELNKAVRQASRGSGWRSTEGCLFREHKNWFVSATPSVHRNAEKTDVCIDVKPMAIDPIFWEIFYPESADAPLSFRFNGAWVCRPPEFGTYDVPELGGAVSMAATILGIADLKLKEIERTVTIDGFLQKCIERNGNFNSYQASVICTLIALHREAEALEVAQHGQRLGLSGGYGTIAKSFNDFAVDWLTSNGGTKR